MKELLLKKETDNVLSEVRKKMQDVQNMKKLLQSLKNLRDIKLKKRESSKVVTDPQSTIHFHNVIGKIL